ncbi:proline/betaine transporter [mine drainage metagenome]|uniref:Proline/betaine transporter n=1 Tax=mine drainage metagenome TaxID=410659 RepID=A0A1J5PXJ2_9ZZZZ
MHLPKTFMLMVHVTSAAFSALTIPAYAYISDRIGRKPVFLFGALMSAILIWPYLWAIGQSNETLVFVFCTLLMGVAYSATNGVWPALYGEMFSTNVRLSGVAIGTQFGFALAAQAPTLAAYFALESPVNWTPVAWLVSISCTISAGAVLSAKETSQSNLNDLGRMPSLQKPNK